ncbi:hypothetical protein [Desulforamulus hydrothermalis]|uniref:Uncharacterized protein n=1 Tax=Desulforamulus hydrothermalis Lam5 = DSM 18033 TaxID=1121428 RepID=K8DZ59_9FIRM|nr:hypothetical protein [Desulforamulus hydrothermalis]CCO08274.1 conserved hypothetical protein [Desulforamulus hydrothermalis Lam5 = DSM 18033]SHH37414.1 hypothetical protein SAMN02745177_02338 [Desulforamulus hydrothermalis Lam5 = DSM 18033]
MTQAELYAALKTLDLPVAYGEFTNPQVPPFITYHHAYSNDMMADNHNYLDVANYQIELYTTKKDPATEKKVQDLLKSLRLPYSKVEAYIESEGLRQVIYEIQLIGG